VLLRKRRTKLKVEQFHIIAQIGQGGYGEVFLARKQESGEVCALKKLRKRTLAKMDEVCVGPSRVADSLIGILSRFATFSWNATS
jgi:serine/threonine protein kinase